MVNFNERILQKLQTSLNQPFSITLQQLFQEGFDIRLPIFEDKVFKRIKWRMHEEYHSIIPITGERLEEYRTVYNNLGILNR